MITVIYYVCFCSSVVYSGPSAEAVNFFIQKPMDSVANRESVANFSLLLNASAILEQHKSELSDPVGNKNTHSVEDANPVDFLLSLSFPAVVSDALTHDQVNLIVPLDSGSSGRPRSAFTTGIILLERSCLSLFKNYRLLGTSFMVSSFFAIMFPLTMGDTSEDEFG